MRLIVKARGKPLVCLLALVAFGVGWGWWRLGGSHSGAAADAVSASVAPGYPRSLHELLASTPSRSTECDIALLNLLCAEGLSGAERLNLQDCIATLGGWADRVRSETERHLYRYQANPREFESSEGYFRMLMMAVVVYEDFSVRYNPERMSTPGAVDPNDHFFADSRDLFLHGLLGREVQSLKAKVQSPNSPSPSPLPEERGGRPKTEDRSLKSASGYLSQHPTTNIERPTSNVSVALGTCSSMPVLYVAIGRRLGYPLKLATTKSHLFIRWEGAGERFDLEATGRGMNRHDDEHFKQWPYPVSEEEIQADGYLKSLTPVEELALFLSLRGHCLKEAGRISEAVGCYAEAVRLAPASRPYRLLLAATQQERAFPASGAGVPPATGLPSTYAQATPLLPPPPAAYGFVPGSPSPTARQATPADAVSGFPQSPVTSLLTPNQPADPNPLLKIRQP
jgi:hypothetical protein